MDVLVSLTPGASPVTHDADELEAVAKATDAIVTLNPASGIHTLGTAGSQSRLMFAHRAAGGWSYVHFVDERAAKRAAAEKAGK